MKTIRQSKFDSRDVGTLGLLIVCLGLILFGASNHRTTVTVTNNYNLEREVQSNAIPQQLPHCTQTQFKIFNRSLSDKEIKDIHDYGTCYPANCPQAKNNPKHCISTYMVVCGYNSTKFYTGYYDPRWDPRIGIINDNITWTFFNNSWYKTTDTGESYE